MLFMSFDHNEFSVMLPYVITSTHSKARPKQGAEQSAGMGSVQNTLVRSTLMLHQK